MPKYTVTLPIVGSIVTKRPITAATEQQAINIAWKQYEDHESYFDVNEREARSEVVTPYGSFSGQNEPEAWKDSDD